MKRSWTAFRSTLLLSGLAASGPVLAQTITVDALDAPKAFTPGIEVDGALQAEAWQGTSADRAVRLIETMPVETTHPIVRDMMRRVILSGLVPPRGAGADYDTARIAAAQTLASPEEYERFAARNPAAQDPKLRADAFIAEGNLLSACEISDALQQGRGDSYWIRVRAACHDVRAETSLADLARDILRDRGEVAELIVPDPPEDFWVRAMALDEAALLSMMTDLAGPPNDEGNLRPDLGEGETEEVEPTLLFPPSGAEVADPLFESDPDAGPGFDLEEALDDSSDQGTAQLFLLAKDGDARAVAAFVNRAIAAGLDPNTVLPRIPAILDPTDMALADLPLFARYAAMTRDIPLMQALFIATEDEGVRERLALASDALGGGYIGRPLGEGLETALEEGVLGADKDVLIALALGSNLEEEVEAQLLSIPSSQVPVVSWIALDQAIDRGTQAEALLRLAVVLDQRDEDDGVTLYRVLLNLRNAGLSETAGQLAAYEFLRDL